MIVPGSRRSADSSLLQVDRPRRANDRSAALLAAYRLALTPSSCATPFRMRWCPCSYGNALAHDSNAPTRCRGSRSEDRAGSERSIGPGGTVCIEHRARELGSPARIWRSLPQETEESHLADRLSSTQTQLSQSHCQCNRVFLSLHSGQEVRCTLLNYRFLVVSL